MFNILQTNGINNKEEFLRQIKTQAEFAKLTYMLGSSKKNCTVQLEFTLNSKRWEFVKAVDVIPGDQDKYASICVAGQSVSGTELADLVTEAISHFQQLSYQFNVQKGQNLNKKNAALKQ